MLWFAPSERGLALGIRQTAIPLGGLVVALVVPHLTGELRLARGIPVPRRARGGRRRRRAARHPWPGRHRRARARLSRHDAARQAAVAAVSLERRSTCTRRSRSSASACSSSTTSTGSPTRPPRSSWPGRRCSRSVCASATGRWSDSSALGSARCGGSGLAVAASLAVTAIFAGGPVWALVPALAVAGRAVDGVERPLVHGGGRARGCGAQRCRDRLPADDPLRARGGCAAPLRAERVLVVVDGRVRDRRRAAARRLARASSAAGLLRSSGADCRSVSTSCMRSAAGRARTVRTARRPRTRRTRSRRRGSRRQASRSRSIATATSSDMPRLSETVSDTGTCPVWVGSHLDSVPARRPLRRRARGRRGDRGGRAGRKRLRRRLSRGGGRMHRQPRPRRERRSQLPRAFLELHVEQGPIARRTRTRRSAS